MHCCMRFDIERSAHVNFECTVLHVVRREEDSIFSSSYSLMVGELESVTKLSIICKIRAFTSPAAAHPQPVSLSVTILIAPPRRTELH